MDNKEENMEDMSSENKNEESPSLLEMEERLANNEGEGIFACPQCGTGVPIESNQCPGCNVMFDEVPESANAEEEHMPSVADLGNGMIPNEPQEPEEEYEDETAEQVQQVPEQNPQPVRSQEPQQERKIGAAIADYYERRKKRYLMGALSLGIGIVLFVTMWLVVVNRVVVDSAQNVLGFEVLVLMIAAGVFFILGLYLTLTYPSSSLAKLLTSMSMTVAYDRGNPPQR